jgi:predicted cobalt transporter CbtA
MSGLSLGTIVRAALIAGIAAGLTAAIFHLLVTEPLIDQAITLEEQHQAPGEHDEPIVSRSAQKGGLVLGFLMYGLVWSLLLALAYHLTQRWLPAAGRGQRLLLVLAAYWAVALFPFLKYPANPPGVGDPETIAYRQTLYLAALALALLGSVLALGLARRAAGQAQGARGWLLALAFLVLFSVALYAVLPNNPDPVEMPAELVARFRTLSLIGLTLFWAVFGTLFALLLGAGPAARARPSLAH